VANAFIVGSFPAIANRLGGPVFVAFAVLMAIQFFVILYVYPETKQVNLEALASGISQQDVKRSNKRTRGQER